MRINNKTISFLIIMMFACVAGKAQMGLIFSPMGSSTNAYTATSTPVMMGGKGNCIVTSSGLSSLRVATNGKGVFGAGCVETPPVANVAAFSVSLNLYPNPTHGITTIKCDGQFDVNLSCQITVMSIDGKVMMKQMVSMKDVKAGFTFNAASYAAGTYVAIVEFMNQRYPVKFIKA